MTVRGNTTLEDGRGWTGPNSDPDDYDDTDLPLTDYWESNAVISRSEVPCPRCKGTGMDRWEEDECQECFGDGTILNALPIVPRIG